MTVHTKNRQQSPDILMAIQDRIHTLTKDEELALRENHSHLLKFLDLHHMQMNYPQNRLHGLI